MVPKGWSKKAFGTVTNIANGQVDPKVEPYASMLHIGPENVVSDSGQVIGLNKCKELGLISGKYEFDENAIVYSKIRPNLNKVCKPGFHGVCSADMYPIWGVEKQLDSDFLLHYMLGPAFYKVAVAMSMRTGMPKINRSDLNAVSVLLPPLPEQKKIAQILSTWDKAITTTEQLLANSQQQKKALMQQLLTGKKRLLDKNGVRFSGEWNALNLGEILSKVSNGVTYDAKNVEGLPVTRIETISTGKVNFNKVGFAPDEENTRRFKLHQGDILYSHINSLEHIGRVAYFNDARPLYHGMNLLLLRTGEKHDSLYIYYLLGSELGKKYAKSYAKSAVNQASISTTDVKAFRFLIPNLPEQQKIAAVLSTADQEITALQQKLDALKQEKKALMQQLLTGKRRVKVEEAA